MMFYDDMMCFYYLNSAGSIYCAYMFRFDLGDVIAYQYPLQYKNSDHCCCVLKRHNSVALLPMANFDNEAVSSRLAI